MLVWDPRGANRFMYRHPDSALSPVLVPDSSQLLPICNAVLAVRESETTFITFLHLRPAPPLSPSTDAAGQSPPPPRHPLFLRLAVPAASLVRVLTRPSGQPSDRRWASFGFGCPVFQSVSPTLAPLPNAHDGRGGGPSSPG